VAWLENEFLIHMQDGAWSLTPIGDQWAPEEETLMPTILVNPRMTGKMYCRWEFLGTLAGEDPTRWWMRCTCERHTERAVLAANVRSGLSKSCGCIRDNSIVRNKPRMVTEEQIREAADRHHAGESFPAIARSLGERVNPNGLRDLCVRRGLITVDPRGNSPERLREHALAVRQQL